MYLVDQEQLRQLKKLNCKSYWVLKWTDFPHSVEFQTCIDIIIYFEMFICLSELLILCHTNSCCTIEVKCLTISWHSVIALYDCKCMFCNLLSEFPHKLLHNMSAMFHNYLSQSQNYATDFLLSRSPPYKFPSPTSSSSITVYYNYITITLQRVQYWSSKYFTLLGVIGNGKFGAFQ